MASFNGPVKTSGGDSFFCLPRKSALTQAQPTVDPPATASKVASNTARRASFRMGAYRTGFGAVARCAALLVFWLVRLPKQKVIVQEQSKELPSAIRRLLEECKAKRLTGWINVVYEDSHDLIFLVDGEMAGWGIFQGDARRRTSPLEIYRRAQEKAVGAVSFYGLPASLVRMVWTTFVSRPKMGDLRMRTADFKKFAGALMKQFFDGYLEVIVDGGANFLEFARGQLRAVY